MHRLQQHILQQLITNDQLRYSDLKPADVADLTHRGDGYITILQDGEHVSELLFHLFTAENPRGKFSSRSKSGETFWARLETIPQTELIPSIPDLVKLIKANPKQRFFAELTYNL